MHRREREIRRLVADMGMEITSWRTDGGSHWRVDIKTPNGRQRPFTFTTREGDTRLAQNERAMLRRWRREVMPELEAAEEAGALKPPPMMQGALADKLEKLGIPLKRVSDELPPSHVSDVVLASCAVGDERWEKRVISIPPRDVREQMPPPFRPGTPEHALVQAEKRLTQPPAPTPSPSPAPAPKEPEMQTQTHSQPRKHVQHKKREQMSFAEVMRFGAWMNKDRLEGYYTKVDFLEHASRALTFRVSENALDAWLEEHGVAMPQRPVPPKQKSWQELVNDDIAAIALALSEAAVPMDHKTAMLAIVERRTKA